MSLSHEAVATLSRLAVSADAETKKGILFEGYLLRGSRRSFRLLVGPLCLELRRVDVVRVWEDVNARKGEFSMRIRVLLRPGAHLLDVSPSDAYQHLVPRRQPFAISSRAVPVSFVHSRRFLALEREFLVRYGIAN